GKRSLLSPRYRLAVPPHHRPPPVPDHYSQLSLLLDTSVSQSSSLVHLHSPPDYQPGRGNLWAPPLPFRRQPPQLNYPPDTVPEPDHGPKLDAQNSQSGISPTPPPPLE